MSLTGMPEYFLAEKYASRMLSVLGSKESTVELLLEYADKVKELDKE